MFTHSALSPFFARQRTLIVPMDHGVAIPVPQLADLRKLIRDFIPFADGFVLNPGPALAFASELQGKALCLRADSYNPRIDEAFGSGSQILTNTAEAKRLGAHAFMHMLHPEHPREGEILKDCRQIVREGLLENIPTIVESLPVGLGQPQAYTTENIAFAVRQAAEIGAAVVKTAFPTQGTVDDFKHVVQQSFVPVIILGGSALGDDRGLLDMVRKSLDAGGMGIAIGRNVWQHPHPASIIAALSSLIHDDASVETALKNL